MITEWCKLKVRASGGDTYQTFSAMIFISVLLGLIDFSDIVMLGSGPIVVANKTLSAYQSSQKLSRVRRPFFNPPCHTLSVVPSSGTRLEMKTRAHDVNLPLQSDAR